MSNFSRFILIVFVCVLLVGCYESFAPVKSANLTRWQKGKIQGTELQLTSKQIANLSEWLQSHKWGWQPVSGTFLPVTLLSLSHVDGSFSSANLMKNTLVVGKYQRSLSATESQELHSIVGVQIGSYSSNFK